MQTKYKTQRVARPVTFSWMTRDARRYSLCRWCSKPIEEDTNDEWLHSDGWKSCNLEEK